jgi:hypothetical protein
MPTCPDCATTIAYPRPNCPSCWATLDLPAASTPPARRRSTPEFNWNWALAAVVVVVLVAIVAAVRVLPDSANSHQPTIPTAGELARAATSADGPLTATAARHIARHWFQQRDAARYANDNAALAEVETGTALQVDRAFTRQISCGCEPLRHQHDLQSVSVVVPNPYTSTFLAHFAGTASNGEHAGYTVVLTFTAGVWKSPLLVLDGHRTTITARAHAAPMATMGGNPAVAAAAAYLMHWLHVGSAPRSGVTWTGNAQYVGHSWARLGRERVDRHTGVRKTQYSAVSDAPAYSFPIAGGTLTCGVIRGADIASAPGGLLLQSPNRHQWGPTIAPGAYPTLRQATTLQTCVISRPHNVRDLLSLYGEQTGIRPGRPPTV